MAKKNSDHNKNNKREEKKMKQNIFFSPIDENEQRKMTMRHTVLDKLTRKSTVCN